MFRALEVTVLSGGLRNHSSTRSSAAKGATRIASMTLDPGRLLGRARLVLQQPSLQELDLRFGGSNLSFRLSLLLFLPGDAGPWPRAWEKDIGFAAASPDSSAENGPQVGVRHMHLVCTDKANSTHSNPKL